MACKGCAITMQSGFLAPLKATWHPQLLKTLLIWAAATTVLPQMA
jgi:hypothetical protein